MSPQDQNQGFTPPFYSNPSTNQPFSAPFFQNGFPFPGYQQNQSQAQGQGQQFPFNGPYQMPAGTAQQPMNFKSLLDGADQFMKVMNKTGPMIKQLAPLFEMMKKF